VDKINAGGTAAVTGTLQLVALGGTYLFGSPYNFLTATGGVSGSFATVTTDAAFGVGVTSNVTYNATNAFVTLTAAPIAAIVAVPSSLALTRPKNVFAVASGMDRAVANGANASAFFNVYNLPTREALAAAVNQLSGEVHTASHAMSVRASDQFLRVMLDPTAIGRDSRLLSAAEGAAFAASKGASELPRGKGPPPAFAAPRDLPKNHRLWGAAMGETARVDGDTFTIGSARIKTNDGQLAVGADVALGRDTMAGVAISAGQSEATLANGMGSAKAEIYQAGLYGMTKFGAFSLAASGAYSSLQMETNRAVPVLGANSVKGKYRAEAWSGRIEGAWAVAKISSITLSPIAAIQVQSVKT
ncbi:MAG: autotransporter outer membrane beta-barrel domain-containing protein, partial [Aeromonas veronii]